MNLWNKSDEILGRSEPARDTSTLLMIDVVIKLLEILNGAILFNLVGIFGLAASVISMAVFAKQGLSTAMNISLFCLALSDFGGVATLVWFGICENPFFKGSDVPMVSNEFNYLTGVWPHVWFARISCWLTAFVTAERYLCIALPLKTKDIITPKRTAVIMCCIYLLTMALLVPQYAAAYIDWQFCAQRNKTVLRLVFIKSKVFLEGLSFILNSANGLLSFITVIVFTAVIIVKLRQERKWRQAFVPETQLFRSKWRKEKKTMLMILLISIALIVCYVPGLAVSMVTFIEPQFSLNGRYAHLFLSSWSFCSFLESVNASVNIFFYYKMSTRYRRAFKAIFVCKTTNKPRL